MENLKEELSRRKAMQTKVAPFLRRTDEISDVSKAEAQSQQEPRRPIQRMSSQQDKQSWKEIRLANTHHIDEPVINHELLAKFGSGNYDL